MTRQDIDRNKRHFFSGLKTVLDGAAEAVPSGLTLGAHYGAQAASRVQSTLSSWAESLNKSRAEIDNRRQGRRR